MKKRYPWIISSTSSTSGRRPMWGIVTTRVYTVHMPGKQWAACSPAPHVVWREDDWHFLNEMDHFEFEFCLVVRIPNCKEFERWQWEAKNNENLKSSILSRLACDSEMFIKSPVQVVILFTPRNAEVVRTVLTQVTLGWLFSVTMGVKLAFEALKI
jgi:hypothetical protein